MPRKEHKKKRPGRRQNVTLAQRLEIINEKKMGARNREIADRYNVGADNVSRIWRLRDQYLGLAERSGIIPLDNSLNITTNSILYEWILRARYHMDVTDDIIRLVRQEVANHINDDFPLDENWLENFKSHYNLQNTPLTGMHTQSVDPANLKSLYVGDIVKYIRKKESQNVNMPESRIKKVRDSTLAKRKDLNKFAIPLTLEQRVNIILEKDRGARNKDIAKRYNIPILRIIRIWRRKEEYLSRHGSANKLDNHLKKVIETMASNKTEERELINPLTLEERVNIILEKIRGVRNIELAERYNVPVKHINITWSRREEYLSRHGSSAALALQGMRRLYTRNPANIATDRIVYEWILRARYHINVTYKEIRLVGMEVAKYLNNKHFQPNPNWFERFKSHYKIKNIQLAGLNKAPVDPANLKSLYVGDIVNYLRQTDAKIIIDCDEYLKEGINCSMSDQCIEDIPMDADDLHAEINQIDAEPNDEAIEIEDAAVRQEDEVIEEISTDPDDVDDDADISHIQGEPNHENIEIAVKQEDEVIEEICTDPDDVDDDADISHIQDEPNHENIEIAVKQEDDVIDVTDFPIQGGDKTESIRLSSEKPLTWKITSYLEAREALAAVEQFFLLKENVRGVCLLNQLQNKLQEETTEGSE